MKLFNLHEDNSLEPSEYTRGPFGGLQGGVVAAMLASQLESLAVTEDLGTPVSVSTTFLRPTPHRKLKAKPSILRRGSRASTLMNELLEGSRTYAISVLNTLKIEPLPGLAPVSSIDLDPLSCPEAPRPPGPGGTIWLMDLFQVRLDQSRNIAWFGLRDEMAVSLSPLSLTLLVADWAHGINRPLATGFADPNINLNVHLSRHPKGRWIGVSAATEWTSNGIGLGNGTLYDPSGAFGRVSASVAVSKMAHTPETQKPAEQNSI